MLPIMLVVYQKLIRVENWAVYNEAEMYFQAHLKHMFPSPFPFDVIIQ